MHTVVPSFKQGEDEVHGWTVVFVEQNRVGEIVVPDRRLVRQYSTSEWDFEQAAHLCNRLNGGSSDATQDIANRMEEIYNSFAEAWDFVKGLIEKEQANG